jgi:hypothetical protein
MDRIHLALTTRLLVDTAFNCGARTYGPYTVGALVDILAADSQYS